LASGEGVQVSRKSLDCFLQAAFLIWRPRDLRQMTALGAHAQYPVQHLRHKLEFRARQPFACPLRKSQNSPFDIAAQYAMIGHGESPFVR
jgi:hypothetical protein